MVDPTIREIRKQALDCVDELLLNIESQEYSPLQHYALRRAVDHFQRAATVLNMVANDRDYLTDFLIEMQRSKGEF